MSHRLESEDQWRVRFTEMKAGMLPKEAAEESNRCLYCYDAPCITACPTGIPIPSFIRRIATGNLKGAATAIMEANPVGASCARVCPTEELCEGACVLNDTSKPIRIGDLQRYATDWAMKNKANLFRAGAPNGKRAAVIGSGPAGLSAARELARLGFEVVIYEAKDKAGGLNAYGIVSYRLPEAVADWEVEQVRELGVVIHTGIEVGKHLAAEELLRGFDAVVLAIGMGKVPGLGIEGEELSGVYDAIELVESTKGESPPSLSGRRVLVIGAGNTAVDAAVTSVRLGAANVKMVYRRTEKEMTAYAFEYASAKEEGVEFRWLLAPKRMIGNEGGAVTGLECVRMRLTESGGAGERAVPEPIPGSEVILPADAVIRAIGQSRLVGLLDSLGVAHDKGIIQVHPETYQTSNPQVYAAGDVLFGSGAGEAMVVSAAQQGKLAAWALNEQLGLRSGFAPQNLSSSLRSGFAPQNLKEESSDGSVD